MHLGASLLLLSDTDKIHVLRNWDYIDKNHKRDIKPGTIFINHVNKFQGKTKHYSTATVLVYWEVEAKEANMSGMI